MSATAEHIATIAVEDNPRTLFKGDNSEHWATESGELFAMTFPAILDFNTNFSRLGPYFSIRSLKPFPVRTMKKVKAVYSLCPIPDIKNHPELAIQCSAQAFRTLICLCDKVEQQRNKEIILLIDYSGKVLPIGKSPTCPTHRDGTGT
ncbi:hypothetical protein SERLA73DRAFT_155317 [Serpula lacrymans var. lacrymans S7.3]|uniref:Uncharacterized protein n=1 Tax=Serpula lacrymans var. lacrymans (strain S7.3) TaxID=936435 RepID=F8Q9C6_SERL3|nr:hypothetical protein SERLA73DRAFT_155317 [Serpula lacrymans var. lacrymans S7.3]